MVSKVFLKVLSNRKALAALLASWDICQAQLRQPVHRYSYMKVQDGIEKSHASVYGFVTDLDRCRFQEELERSVKRGSCDERRSQRPMPW